MEYLISPRCDAGRARVCLQLLLSGKFIVGSRSRYDSRVLATQFLGCRYDLRRLAGSRKLKSPDVVAFARSLLARARNTCERGVIGKYEFRNSAAARVIYAST